MEQQDLIYRASTLEITCPEHWAKTLDMARETRDDSLRNCIWRLMNWNACGDKGMKIVIGRDFVDYSFTFCEVFSDGSTGVNGGIIYYGKPAYFDNEWDKASGCNQHGGWHIHT